LQQQESPDIQEKLKKGHKAGDKTSKVHLDGYNLFPYLIEKEKKFPRIEFFTFLMMEILSLCGMITGSLSLWSSVPEVRYWFGLNLLYIYAYQKYLTCAPIPMNEQIKHPTPTTTDCSITLS
jgi:arylsulfatase